ncbi:hypothetical protein F5Y05DRAFT_226762 [Hypoxylon sp. FL0543]|nr:hypothetical protein F5Y05DRAFT_226762 [Hypoxylon sp. FL0543]
METPPPPFRGQLHCKSHGRLTCKVCLHSINADLDGYIGHPREVRYGCSESEHSVEARFEYFNDRATRLLGFHDGLGPTDRRRRLADDFSIGTQFKQDVDFGCDECALRYWAGGGIGMYGVHPSHICSNGQRYILAWACPFKFARGVEMIECSAYFHFNDRSPMNINYKCMLRPDEGTADSNLDNAEIAALTQLLTHVEEKLIPHRKELVKDYLYTNSEYFAGQAWRFRLVVFTYLKPDVLELLLKAHQMEYSAKRKAFIERDMQGVVTKRFRATKERQYQTARFIQKVKDLASLGIQVYWARMEDDARYMAARTRFMDDPYQFPEPRNQVLDDVRNEPNVEQEEGQTIGEDLIEGDSFEYQPGHEGFEAVESENPEESSEMITGLETGHMCQGRNVGLGIYNIDMPRQ